ncbi:MAG: hypothetical protein IPJ88_12970 [Myxococcales bacterium]|nr:MAG: hypothetical protein IPJ88_12970 [Myxococcales bacterium]
MSFELRAKRGTMNTGAMVITNITHCDIKRPVPPRKEPPAYTVFGTKGIWMIVQTILNAAKT